MSNSLVFYNLYLLYADEIEIYGNESLLLCKLGRLLLACSRGSGIKFYVLNSRAIPISTYHAKKLKDECLTRRKSFEQAFGIFTHSRPLHVEPDVHFQEDLDGSFSVHLNDPPIKMEDSVDLYNMLRDETQGSRVSIFFDLVKYRDKTDHCVSVYLHDNEKLPPANNYDVVINVTTAGSMLWNIPYYWSVYYTAGTSLEYEPALIRLRKEQLRPLA